MELIEITLNYKGNDVALEVDRSTANILLNDPNIAENYLKQIFEREETVNCDNNKCNEIEQTQNNENETECMVFNEGLGDLHEREIWSSRKPTKIDEKATILFLPLRAKYAEQFDDKKTVKSQLWRKIATEMSSNYNLGENAIEKCRQKFANLQKQYFKHVKHMNATGAEFKEAPPYFDQLHDILGYKDKSNPQNLQDSLETINNNIDCLSSDSSSAIDQIEAVPSCSYESDNDEATKIRNRFKKVSRTVRPLSKTNEILELIKSHHKDEVESRQKYLGILEDAVQTQQAQSDRLLNILEKMMISKKRKRRESSDESD